MTHAAVAHAPMVSVVIPAYNVSGYIGETLASVFAQRYTDFEVLVVNDGSPDTAALEAAIAPHRDRITYVVQPNAGPSAARNAAIERARGTYVAFIDGDDRWLPDCLEQQMARALADPTLAVLHGDAAVIGNPALAGKTLRQLNGSQGQADFLSLVSGRCTLTTSCTMVRRDACVAAGMFDPALRRSEDFDLWLRIAHAGGRFDGTTRVLGEYRRNGTGASSDENAMAEAVLAVMDKCERTLPLTAEARAAVDDTRRTQQAIRHFLAGKRAFACGDYQTARNALRAANATMRSRKLAFVVGALSVAPGLLARLYALRHPRTP